MDIALLILSGPLFVLCAYLLITFLTTGEATRYLTAKRSENPIGYWRNVLFMLLMATVGLGTVSHSASIVFGIPDLFDVVLDWFGINALLEWLNSERRG